MTIFASFRCADYGASGCRSWSPGRGERDPAGVHQRLWDL